MQDKSCYPAFDEKVGVGVPDLQTVQETIQHQVANAAGRALQLAADALLDQRDAEGALGWLRLRDELNRAHFNRGNLIWDLKNSTPIHDDEELVATFREIHQTLKELERLMTDAAAEALTKGHPTWADHELRNALAKTGQMETSLDVSAARQLLERRKFIEEHRKEMELLLAVIESRGRRGSPT
jgi:hypothetical protein